MARVVVGRFVGRWLGGFWVSERRSLDVVPLDAVPDAVVGVAGDGVVVLANSRAEALFGCARGGLVGRPLELLVPVAQRPVHGAYRAAFFEDPRVRAMGAGVRLSARRLDGSEFEAEISLAPFDTGDGVIAIATVRDMTASRDADRVLRETQAQMQAIFDHLPAALSLLDSAGRFRVVNAYAAGLLGMTPEAMAGTRPADYHEPAIAHWLSNSERIVRESGGEVAEELTVNHGDGSERDYTVVRFPVPDAEGRLSGIGSFSFEVTALRRAERAREQVLAELQEAQHIAQLGSWQWDPGTGTRAWSEGMYSVYGADAAAGPLGTETTFAFVHPDDLGRVKSAYAAMLAGGAGFELEYRLLTPDRGTRMVHAIARPDPARPGCYRGTLQDVTAVRESEQALRTVIDHAPIGMALTRPGGRFERVNQALCNLLGYREDEWPGMTFADVTHPDDLAESIAQNALASRSPLARGQVQKRYVHRDGRTIWARVSFAAVGEDGGIPRYVISQVQDITTERAAAETIARLAEVVESTSDAISTTTLDGTITTWNAAAERIFGYSAAEMIGRSVMDLAPENAREREAPDTLARVHRGERVEPFDTVRRRNDGSLIDVSMTVSAIRDADGVVIGASSVARDITASKQLADRTLAEAQDRFRGTFESAPIGMGLSDLDGRYVQVNEALCEITGYTAEQLCATSFHAITHPDDRAQDHELIAALQSGALDRCHREKRYLHASGEPVWVALDATDPARPRRPPTASAQPGRRHHPAAGAGE